MTIQVAQRIGRALSISSATKLRELDTALREYVRGVGPAASTPFAGTIDASQVVSGSFANARVQQSNVTQHQAALAIAYAQLTGVPATFPPSAHTHPNGDLTGYTAADVLAKLLTVDGAASGLDADLLDGLNSTDFGRLGANQTVLATWTFNTGIIQAFNNGGGVCSVRLQSKQLADDATDTWNVGNFGLTAVITRVGSTVSRNGIFWHATGAETTALINGGANFSLGTTVNPDVDGNINAWMSAASTLSIKNRHGSTRDILVANFSLV